MYKGDEALVRPARLARRRFPSVPVPPRWRLRNQFAAECVEQWLERTGDGHPVAAGDQHAQRRTVVPGHNGAGVAGAGELGRPAPAGDPRFDQQDVFKDRDSVPAGYGNGGLRVEDAAPGQAGANADLEDLVATHRGGGRLERGELLLAEESILALNALLEHRHRTLELIVRPRIGAGGA